MIAHWIAGFGLIAVTSCASLVPKESIHSEWMSAGFKVTGPRLREELGIPERLRKSRRDLPYLVFHAESDSHAVTMMLEMRTKGLDTFFPGEKVYRLASAGDPLHDYMHLASLLVDSTGACRTISTLRAAESAMADSPGRARTRDEVRDAVLVFADLLGYLLVTDIDPETKTSIEAMRRQWAFLNRDPGPSRQKEEDGFGEEDFTLVIQPTDGGWDCKATFLIHRPTWHIQRFRFRITNNPSPKTPWFKIDEDPETLWKVRLM
jgi:hypothetical protein